jgi:hypothetical protein
VLAQGAAVGFARTLDSTQECGVERVGLGRVPTLAGAHMLLFFASGFLGHADAIKVGTLNTDKAKARRRFWKPLISFLN